MNKKNIILIIIVLLLIASTIFMSIFVFNRNSLKKNLEDCVLPFANKNERTIFTLDKTTIFSGCNAKNKNASASNFTIENLYQYTDIALFIKSSSEEKNSENTLKKVWINNLKFNTSPETGSANLYYKNINNFAKSDLISSNPFNDTLDFEITSDSEANLDNPTLYNNLANPIVLSYINSNIKSDYTITDTSIPITYDGSLLKRCNIALNSLNCNFSFDIYVVNNLDQEFKCTAFINIPLENNEHSIYDGSILQKQDTNSAFYRYK